MGMSSSSQPQKQVNNRPVPSPLNPVSTDPSSILKKLNEKDSEFISAYNASAFQQRGTDK